MQIHSETDRDEVRAYRLYGFRRGVGFTSSSIDVDSSIEMMLEFDDEPEKLRDQDLDTEETWPSRRRRTG